MMILELATLDDGSTAQPAEKCKRRRYTLRDILCSATPEASRQIHEETTWAREGGLVGREL
jgi:hypothetical protein